jgi:CheY-like chemotaxis protein
MKSGGTYGKILVVDTNIFFVKRVTEALRQQNFEVAHCSDPVYALTMIEWNMPVAILCATNFQNSMGMEIPTILRADPKTSHIPVIGIGNRGQQSQLEVLRAGYEDFLDRRLGAEEIAAHLVSFLACHRDGFQPTQMLTRAETALDGRLSLVDLPGVIQVLEQSRQTGALHINAAATDGIIFFNSGEAIHAESGRFAGDEAIVHLIKCCHGVTDGVYKFIPGDPATLRTVQGNLNGLILDALRQLDEKEHGVQEEESGQDESEGQHLGETESGIPDTTHIQEPGPLPDLVPSQVLEDQPATEQVQDPSCELVEARPDLAAESNPPQVPSEQRSDSEAINDVLHALGEQVFSSLAESDFMRALGGK